jgi:hypothetical protein
MVLRFYLRNGWQSDRHELASNSQEGVMLPLQT